MTRQTLGAQDWDVKAARVWLSWGGEQPYWLLRARNVRTGEEKYFVSNAAAEEPVARLLRAGFCRWNIEHGLRLGKSEIGFRHFEGRSYVGLMRHLLLCCVTLTFAAGQAADLRGEKSGGDDGASLPRAQLGVRTLARTAPGDHPTAVHGRGRQLPPAA